jgi:hypothetical protein
LKSLFQFVVISLLYFARANISKFARRRSRLTIFGKSIIYEPKLLILRGALMKLAILAGLFTLSAITANAAETRITGAVAQELYAKLNITEVAVKDEHGGTTIGTAKYGKLIGCQMDLSESIFECWISAK